MSDRAFPPSELAEVVRDILEEDTDEKHAEEGRQADVDPGGAGEEGAGPPHQLSSNWKIIAL